MFYQFYATNYLNFTLVMHPVGRHLDEFSDRKPSLENKVFFSFPLSKNESSGLANTGYKYGRGGAGLNKFCYALLDWSAENRIRVSCWTDPRNQNLEYSAFWYATRNNHPNQRCTRSVWTNFSQNNVGIHLPEGVSDIIEMDYNN